MSGYSAQKPSNMSEYIANLNMAPPTQDLPNGSEFNMDDELAMFTNTQFFDFDLGQDANLQPTNFDRSTTENELKPLDFDLNGEQGVDSLCSYSSNLPPLFPCTSS